MRGNWLTAAGGQPPRPRAHQHRSPGPVRGALQLAHNLRDLGVRARAVEDLRAELWCWRRLLLLLRLCRLHWRTSWGAAGRQRSLLCLRCGLACVLGLQQVLCPADRADHQACDRPVRADRDLAAHSLAFSADCQARALHSRLIVLPVPACGAGSAQVACGGSVHLSSACLWVIRGAHWCGWTGTTASCCRRPAASRRLHHKRVSRLRACTCSQDRSSPTRKGHLDVIACDLVVVAHPAAQQ